MKILINRTDAIGDTILTIPIARVIKQRFQDVHITFLISEKTLPLFGKERSVDEVTVLNRKSSLISQYLMLRKLFNASKYDMYLYAGGSHLPSYVAKQLNVEIRGGLKSRWPSFFTLNSGVRQKRSNVEMHELNYNMGLLKPIGIELGKEELRNFYPQIFLNDGESKKSIDNLKQELLDNKQESMVKYLDSSDFIIIHPGMMGHTLNMSSAEYAKIMFELSRIYKDRFMFVISYTPGDKRYIDGFKKEVEKLVSQEKIQPTMIYYDGSKRGLRDYIGLMSNAALFIGPSTGPLHIANALGIKIIGVYSPILVQSSSRWGPIPRERSRVRVVVPNVVCGEQFSCMGRDCPYYECMDRIGIEYIVNEIKDLLGSD